jgi:hypothetical protein
MIFLKKLFKKNDSPIFLESKETIVHIKTDDSETIHTYQFKKFIVGEIVNKIFCIYSEHDDCHHYANKVITSFVNHFELNNICLSYAYLILESIDKKLVDNLEESEEWLALIIIIFWMAMKMVEDNWYSNKVIRETLNKTYNTIIFTPSYMLLYELMIFKACKYNIFYTYDEILATVKMMRNYETIEKNLTDLGQKIDSVYEKTKDMKKCSHVIENIKINDFYKYVRYNDYHYDKNKILTTKYFNIYIVSWKSEQHTEIHDHHDDGCIAKLLLGELVEDTYKNIFLPNIKKITHVNRKIVSVNNIFFICGREKLHKITAMRDSVSLHIYPISYKMNIYTL